MFERAHKGGYFVQGTLCGGGFCMCNDPERGGHYKGDECTHDAFWSNVPAADIAKHTPLLKLTHEHTEALGVATEDQVMSIFDEHPSSLLAQLLQRDPSPLTDPSSVRGGSPL